MPVSAAAGSISPLQPGLRRPARLVERDLPIDYREARYVAIGRIDGRVFVVVYTPRHDRLRLISARKANPREVRRYGDGPRDSNG